MIPPGAGYLRRGSIYQIFAARFARRVDFLRDLPFTDSAKPQIFAGRFARRVDFLRDPGLCPEVVIREPEVGGSLRSRRLVAKPVRGRAHGAEERLRSCAVVFAIPQANSGCFWVNILLYRRIRAVGKSRPKRCGSEQWGIQGPNGKAQKAALRRPPGCCGNLPRYIGFL